MSIMEDSGKSIVKYSRQHKEEENTLRHEGGNVFTLSAKKDSEWESVVKYTTDVKFEFGNIVCVVSSLDDDIAKSACTDVVLSDKTGRSPDKSAEEEVVDDDGLASNTSKAADASPSDVVHEQSSQEEIPLRIKRGFVDSSDDQKIISVVVDKVDGVEYPTSMPIKFTCFYKGNAFLGPKDVPGEYFEYVVIRQQHLECAKDAPEQKLKIVKDDTPIVKLTAME